MERDKIYILYDGRAMYDVDKATVLTVSETLEEAREDAKMFGDSVVYSYKVVDDHDLVDEQFEEYFSGKG